MYFVCLSLYLDVFIYLKNDTLCTFILIFKKKSRKTIKKFMGRINSKSIF